MIKPPMIATRPFKSMTKEQFFRLVDGLYKNPNTNASRQVPGVSVSIGESKMIVRIDRNEKRLTWKEFQLLAAEYKQNTESFLEQLLKRKIEILDETGAMIGKPKRARKARAQGNDAGKPKRKRKAKATHELLEPVDTERLPEKSPLLLPEGAEA